MQDMKFSKDVESITTHPEREIQSFSL